MKDITQLSEHLASLIETASQSLVRVRGRRRRGSGVAFSSEGLIVTSGRAVGRGNAVEIGLPDGSTVDAEPVGRDPATDLAVVRLTDTQLTAANWSDGEDLKVGHLVLTLGRPGHGPRATFGMIGGLGGAWRTPWGGRVDRYIEVDGTLPRGFSGGVLIDLAGGVLGVNSAGLVQGGTTLPTSTVLRVVDQIVSHGRVRRGYLGVTVHSTGLPEALAKELGQSGGVLLASVEPDGPADNAGLLLGDVILTVSDDPVEHTDDLLAALSERAGTEASLRFLRAGEIRECSVAVGERPTRGCG